MILELEREILALRAQLAEAEQMRRAIVQARIDGFVVGEDDSERQVLLLSQALSRELLDIARQMRACLEALGREAPAAAGPLERQIERLQRLAEARRPNGAT